MEKHIETFGKAAQSYEKAGELQRYVAARLAERILDSSPARGGTILEVGCGTGFLTQHLQSIFGSSASYIITDAAPDMLESCRSSFNASAHMRFDIMDGQNIPLPERSIDSINTSMAIQWFDDSSQTLRNWQKLLKPSGALNYATIGPSTFSEWRLHLAGRGLDFGMRPQPRKLPGQTDHELITRDYGSGLGFLKMLAATGAGTPKPDYREPPKEEFRQAVKTFDGIVTWHIVYGHLPALSL